MLRAILLIMPLLVGCTTLNFRAEGVIPTFISAQPDHIHKVESEGVKEFYFWGLLPARQTVFIDRELADQGVTSVANVSVHEYQTWGNFFKGLFSFGIYVPRNYRVSGYGVRPVEEF